MGVVLGQMEVELLWMKVVMGDRRDTINESSCTLEESSSSLVEGKMLLLSWKPKPQERSYLDSE